MTYDEYLEIANRHVGEMCSMCSGGSLEIASDGTLKCDVCEMEYTVWPDGTIGYEPYED